MLEKTIEAYLSRQVRAVGGRSYKFLSTVRGVPDRVVLIDGRAWFVELKTMSGRVSRAQAVQHRVFQALGFPVEIIRSREEVNQFVDRICAARVSGDGHQLDPEQAEVRSVPGHGAGQDGVRADGDRPADLRLAGDPQGAGDRAAQSGKGYLACGTS